MKKALSLPSVILIITLSSKAFSQAPEKMTAITPENFSNGVSSDEITDETVVTFRYGPKKGANSTYFGSPTNNNFTWYRKVERTVRVYLSEGDGVGGLSIRVNTTQDHLTELNAILYSLAGQKVNKAKLGRKSFNKASDGDYTVYTPALPQNFKNDILEINYAVESAYNGEESTWIANELFAKGGARYEFQAPEYMDFQLVNLNTNENDVSLKEDTKAGYISMEVYGDETGKMALKKVSINYQINRSVFVLRGLPTPVNRAIVSRMVASKAVPPR